MSLLYAQLLRPENRGDILTSFGLFGRELDPVLSHVPCLIARPHYVDRVSSVFLCHSPSFFRFSSLCSPLPVFVPIPFLFLPCCGHCFSQLSLLDSLQGESVGK